MHKIHLLPLLFQFLVNPAFDMVCSKLFAIMLHKHTTMFAPHFSRMVTSIPPYHLKIEQPVWLLSFLFHAFLFVCAMRLLVGLGQMGTHQKPTWMNANCATKSTQSNHSKSKKKKGTDHTIT